MGITRGTCRLVINEEGRRNGLNFSGNRLKRSLNRFSTKFSSDETMKCRAYTIYYVWHIQLSAEVNSCIVGVSWGHVEIGDF